MEIKVGGIYKTKGNVLCWNGRLLPQGITCKVERIIPRYFNGGADVRIKDSLFNEYWFVDTDYLEEVDTMEKDKNMASEGQHQMKVLITFADATTVAQLLKGDKTVKTANAYCAPGDKFNIEVGANLALERLFEKKKGLTPLTETIISLADMTGGKSLLDFIDKDKTGTEIDRLENKSDLCKIADHYGLNNQKLKLQEELGELITAGARNDNIDFVEEMADVSIMIEQMVYLLKKESLFAETREKKLDRQIKRIENEEKIAKKRDCADCKHYSSEGRDMVFCRSCAFKNTHPNWEKR